MAQIEEDTPAGQEPIDGGYSTKVIRLWNAIFVAYGVFTQTPVTVTYGDGTTEAVTPKTVVLRHYAPV